MLGIHSRRIRCIHLPSFEHHGYSLHMYLDLEGVKHGLPHNTNATQLFLIAQLPQEPPDFWPDSINGPAMITAEEANGSGRFIDLDQQVSRINPMVLRT